MRAKEIIGSVRSHEIVPNHSSKPRPPSRRMDGITHRPILTQHLCILQNPPVINIANNAFVQRLGCQPINSDARNRAHRNHTGNRIALLQHCSNPERNNIQALLAINHLAIIHSLEQALLRRALDASCVAPDPQAAELVLLRAPEAHEDEAERVDVAALLRLHEFGRADASELLGRLHRVGDAGLLRFLERSVCVDGVAEGPDAAAYAPAAEAFEQVVGQVIEVVVQDLGDFGMGAVFVGQRAAGEAVDVLNLAVVETLFEDFGADEAGRAGEDDLGHGYRCGQLL